MPWVPATIISGSLQALCGLVTLVYWYSYSASGWVQKSLFATMAAHPEAAIPPDTVGFAGLVLIAAHPLTWAIAAFALEGVVRICSAAFTGQILGIFPLFVAEKFSALFFSEERATEDSQNSVRPTVSSFFDTLHQKYLSSTLPLVPDELHYTAGNSEQFLEIRACRSKPEWDPPRVVRYRDGYFRLERSTRNPGSRPFLYVLRRLSGGVPGRGVIEYSPDLSPLVRN